MPISLEIILIFLLILLNGFLAMSEMAVVSSKRARLKKLHEEGHGGAKRVLDMLDSSGDFLASVQVGITLIGVLAGAFGGATLSESIAATIKETVPFLAPYADALSLGLVVLSVTYLSLVLGELVPKRLALNHPEKIAIKSSKIIVTLTALLRPMVSVLSVSTNFVLALTGVRRKNDEAVTEEEVKLMIEEGTQAGVFDKHESMMMQRVLRLDDYRISDLMTSRTQVIAVDLKEPLDAILKKIHLSKHSYFPVFEASIDEPIGVLSIKSLLACYIQNQPVILKSNLSPCFFLPDTLSADKALERFKKSGERMAIAIDEYGGFSGVVTILDITESIVGMIPDKETNEDMNFVEREDGSTLVDGSTPLVNIMDYLSESFACEDPFQTIGGWVMEQLGRIPREGDHVSLGPYKVEVMDMDRHRVDKVLLQKIS
jgi:putative hemolysin